MKMGSKGEILSSLSMKRKITPPSSHAWLRGANGGRGVVVEWWSLGMMVEKWWSGCRSVREYLLEDIEWKN